MTEDAAIRHVFSPVVLAILTLSAAPEIILQSTELGLLGRSSWRCWAYENGAFWVGLLQGWLPNYPTQPIAMFMTYAFLHAGLSHMLINMLTLLFIAPTMVRIGGAARFIAIYLSAILGGALGFALLTDSFQPMVGASGALFGLVGAWLVWEAADKIRQRPGVLVVAKVIVWPVLILILMNLIMYWSAGGQLAWETHLGGALAGAAAGLLFLPAPEAAARTTD